MRLEVVLRLLQGELRILVYSGEDMLGPCNQTKSLRVIYRKGRQGLCSSCAVVTYTSTTLQSGGTAPSVAVWEVAQRGAGFWEGLGGQDREGVYRAWEIRGWKTVRRSARALLTPRHHGSASHGGIRAARSHANRDANRLTDAVHGGTRRSAARRHTGAAAATTTAVQTRRAARGAR